ncbi:MAG TPA: NAD(P)-binding protein [Candidatus Bipolaricaulis anaerobius]|jgi:2,4-dienoyl-CoA reductase-like NADH-dependent reductase (Old Yellow Enzyme family)|nr:NAD(P)-binding protein [Candidatus Bipolaricaulis anaerobius]HNS24267.1 NAD(P)-binding protein [Candidatus Bipolaricaulis anaerobius]
MGKELKYPRLFEPITLRGVEIKNRILWLPHEPHFGSNDHLPTRQQLYYYRERARGGVGAIGVPSLGVHRSGTYAGLVDAYRPESIPGLRAIVDAVHAYGARIYAQLTHFGNQTKSAETHGPAWAPSAVPDLTVRELPKAMTVDEIQELVASFARAAENVLAAGFDWVEIKVAHDGILRQFLSPAKNKRTDAYGGSLENRARIVMEVLRAVRDAQGDVPLGVRLCLNEYIPHGYGVDEAVEYARMFATVADYINTDAGTWESMHYMVPPMTIPMGYLLGDVARIKQAVNVPVIGTGRIVWPQTAEQALADGACDMIGMARALIADPYWAEKAQRGAPEEIRGCIGCNQKCIGRLLQNLPISCVVNPTSGYEREFGAEFFYRPTRRPRKAVVVGGGPAGMKAAETMARRGHQVVLFEKERRLGGRVNWESALPNRRGVSGAGRYLEQTVTGLARVEVRLGVEADVDAVLLEQPDIVIVATGAMPVAELPGVEAAGNLYHTLDALAGRVEGETLLVMDNDATEEGAGVVELLLGQGKTVHWVTPVFFNGQDINVVVSIPYYQRLGGRDVGLYPMSVVTGFALGTATLLNVQYGTRQEITGVDAIVVTGVWAPKNELYEKLQGRLPRLLILGDAAAPRTLAAALGDAMSLTEDQIEHGKKRR